MSLENYDCEGQMSIFDIANLQPENVKPGYKAALNAVDGKCEFDSRIYCNRYGEGYRDAKPHAHYSCCGCCVYCSAYKTKCLWECRVRV